jgi:hypothetical protein
MGYLPLVFDEKEKVKRGREVEGVKSAFGF